MYAVIETGGKQYRVAPGQSLQVETLPGDVGQQVEFSRVLAIVDGESVKAGASVSGAKVLGTIKLQDRGEKTIVFKFKRKKQYRRTQGHRQNFTRVEVGEILA
jgi:large subunit ribosomal protein L21